MKVGTRVELHPGTDAWMRGDRYGEIVGTSTQRATGTILFKIKMDKSNRTLKVHPDWVNEII